jgi:hypothetical protein
VTTTTAAQTRLFVPLAASAYEWFSSGAKHWEVRRRKGIFAHGVYPGRRVELRRGYSDVRSAIWGTISAVVNAGSVDDMLGSVPYKEVVPHAHDLREAAGIVSEILRIEEHESADLVAFRIEMDSPNAVPTIIPFAPDYRALVESGKKTSTVRLNNRNYEPGPARLVFGGAGEIPAILIAVDRRRASSLNDADAQRDGFNSRDELDEAIRRHYPSYDGTGWINILKFRVIQ